MSKSGVYTLLIIALLVALLISLSKIWKTEGKGAEEWHNEYNICTKQYEGLMRCIYEYDMEPQWRRQESLKRYCHI